MRGLGRHKRDEHGILMGDHRCTPKAIWRAALTAIGRSQFDLDPATNRDATVLASTKYMGPLNDQDGLVLAWFGDVWLNFPFSKPPPWIEKAMAEANRYRSITILGPNDSSTEWWQMLVRFVDARAAWPRRLHFPLPGKPKGSPPGACALFYSGPQSNAWMRYMMSIGCTVDHGCLDGERELIVKPPKKPRALI
jgi:hypothetical protein